MQITLFNLLFKIKIILEIYTDGACLNNGKPNAKAGWGFVVLEHGNKIKECSGLVKGHQTSNTGELTAISEAIYYACEKCYQSILIYSDSRYCIDSLTVWDIEKRRKGKRKANYELIKNIKEIMDSIDVSFEWVKGHSDNCYNDMADKLANDKLHLKYN